MVLSGGLKPKASPSQWSVIHTTVTAKGADSWVLGRALEVSRSESGSCLLHDWLVTF